MAEVREPLLRVHKGSWKLRLARRCHMMDRNASGRIDHVAEGAQAEWLSAMQSLAEQIQKQQQASQQMTQELMNTYMQLLNTPGSYLSGQAEQQQQTLQQQAQQQQQSFQQMTQEVLDSYSQL